LRDTFFSLC